MIDARTCSTCGYVHVSDDVYAVGRFNATPAQYRARFEGSPLRVDRARAEADMCAWRSSRPRRTTGAAVATAPPTAHRPATTAEPQPFPAASMERLAREKAWLDFLTQAAFSLTVWRLDRSLAQHLDSPIEWLRSCVGDLAVLVSKEAADAA